MSSKGKSKAPSKAPAKAPPKKEEKVKEPKEEKPKVAEAGAGDAAKAAAEKAPAKPAKEEEKAAADAGDEEDGSGSESEEEMKDTGKKTDTDVFDSTANLGEKTYPIRAGEIKKGMIVILKDCPCKILEVTTSKTGKHGHAKANITGVDIFTGKKVNDSAPTSHNLTAPFVTTTNLTLTDVTDDGYAVLMNEAGDIREDIKLPDINSPDPELGEQIRAALEAGKGDVICIVTKALDMECITSFKQTEAQMQQEIQQELGQ